MNYELRDFEPKLFTGAMSVDYDTIIERADEALEHPADSAWSDGDLWNTHTMMFSTPDIELTDDYLEGWSNYRTILKALSEAYPDDVSDCTFGHWTYSRFMAIKIRVVDAEGVITPAFCEAVEIAYDLEHNNHLYDEGDYMDLKDEAELEHVKIFANDNDLTLDSLLEAMSDLNVYFDLHEGWYDVDEEALIALAREKASTWEAHYYSGEGHSPEQCYYCARAEEVAV